jgi:hypothetical protein
MKTIARVTFVLYSVILAPLSFAGGSDENANPSHEKRDGCANIVEVKPMISWSNFGDNVPGPMGLGVGGETALSGKWRLVAEVSYWSLNRSDDDISDLQKDDGDGEVIDKSRTATAALIGTRYYGDPTENSWYAGGKIGYMVAKTGYAYKDARLSDSSSGIPLVLEGGYRWLWDSGFTIRVGFSGDRTAMIQRSVTVSRSSDNSAKGKDEVKNTSPKFAPSFDVGLGRAF